MDNLTASTPQTSVELGKARALPGKMTVWVGKWDGDVFTVLRTVSSDKEAKAAVKALGVGKYDTIVGRKGSFEYKKLERDVIS